MDSGRGQRGEEGTQSQRINSLGLLLASLIKTPVSSLGLTWAILLNTSELIKHETLFLKHEVGGFSMNVGLVG